MGEMKRELKKVKVILGLNSTKYTTVQPKVPGIVLLISSGREGERIDLL